MINYCLYDKNHCCDIAADYEILQAALDEASERSHANWKEIEYLLDRVERLEKLLLEHRIDVPPEF